MARVFLDQAERGALQRLAADLGRVFGDRLQSIAAYGADRPLHTLVLVERVSFDDLAACVPLTNGWRRDGLAVPLVLSRPEFLRTLDVFPVEYGAIIDDHVLVLGNDPFVGCHVRDADLRRAVELQARSHLIHLREGYLEAGGSAEAVARLIARSAPAFQALVRNLARLAPDAIPDSTETLQGEISSVNTIAEPSALLARYVADVERIWRHVDAWREE